MRHITEEGSHAAPAEAWDAIAAAYDTYVAPQESDLAHHGLRLAGLRAGERFLDVAAGPGGLSLPAARLGARVVATDWSPAMIERFEARVRAEGLRDAEGRVMDCHALDFPDDTFDVTGSQFGVMLVPDQMTALREMVRVTKRGGRVLLIALGPPAKFEAVQVFQAAVRAVVPGFQGIPEDAPPLEFQVADPEVLRERLVAAGLANVRIDAAVREAIQVRSGQDLWNWCLGSNPIAGTLVANLSADQKASVRAELEGMIGARRGERGVATLSSALNMGVGTK